MVGIVGIITALIVLGISLIITRIATTALSLTGLSWEAAKFQARSAFTGTGFTTREAEKVVSHPLRRKIIMSLMIARSAGLISIIISLILSFGSAGETTRLVRLIWLVTGVGGLWLLARSRYLELWMKRVIKKALDRWTDLEVRDYTDLLKLAGDYTVRELEVQDEDWLADKRLEECQLPDEGVLVLGINRSDGSYVGAPKNETKIYPEDTLILYGRGKVLQNLDERRAGAEGEAEHEKAKSEHKKEESKQERREKDYEHSKES